MYQREIIMAVFRLTEEEEKIRFSIFPSMNLEEFVAMVDRQRGEFNAFSKLEKECVVQKINWLGSKP